MGKKQSNFAFMKSLLASMVSDIEKRMLYKVHIYEYFVKYVCVPSKAFRIVSLKKINFKPFLIINVYI